MLETKQHSGDYAKLEHWRQIFEQTLEVRNSLAEENSVSHSVQSRELDCLTYGEVQIQEAVAVHYRQKLAVQLEMN